MDYARGEAKDAARQQIRGVWAAMTTPFDSSGAVDLDALRRDTAYLVEDLQIDGLFCAGVMAEFWALTVEERRSIVETVLDAAGGRCRVIAHTGHHSAREAIALTRHAEEAGADFAVLVNPYYPRVAESGLHAWFAEVSAAVDIGLWLFDTSYSGYGLSVDLIDALADLDNVCGIKVGHDHERFLEILRRVGDRLVASEPNESRWLENLLDHDMQVFMSSAAPYLYQTPRHKPMLDYTRAALAGDRDLAEAISDSLQPARAVSERFVTGPWRKERLHPIAAIKCWSALLGMAGGNVRSPLPELGEDDQTALATAVADAGLRASGILDTAAATVSTSP